MAKTRQKKISRDVLDNAFYLRINKTKPTPINEFITFVRANGKVSRRSMANMGW